jgi:plasmid stabilization system protein ParE
LLEIYVMIGLEQPAAAERYFDRIEAKANLLSKKAAAPLWPVGCVLPERARVPWIRNVSAERGPRSS